MASTKFSLEGKTILITGASSGIGKETAIQTSSMGAKLILTGRNKKRLEETLGLCKKGNHLIVTADLLKQEQLKELVSKIDTKIDGIVHSAGISDFVISKFIDEKSIYEMMDVNFKIPVLLTALLLRKKKFNKKASMVFLSSIANKGIARLPYFSL